MKISAVIAQVGFIAVAAIAMYLFVASAQNDLRRSACMPLCKLQPAYAGSDRTAPDFELPDMDGHPVRLSSFRGKTVFLNFWTKTCAPCIEEMPSLAELARIGKGRNDFVVLTVSTDAGPAEVRDALQVALGGEPPFPVLFDPESTIVRDRYGTRLFPETWIIDPRGVIRARFDGGRNWAANIAIEVADMVQRAASCPVEFNESRPTGRFAGVCDDDS